MKEKRCGTQKLASAHPMASESDSAASATTGGPSTSSPATEAAPVAKRTSVNLAARSAERRVLSSGWSLESFDLGFKCGRAIELGGLHIVLTDTDNAGPFEVPAEVLAWLLTGEERCR